MGYRGSVVGALAMLGLAIALPAFAQVRAELVVSGLTQPVAVVQDPSDATLFLIVQQNGRIRAVKNGVLQTTDYLNLVGVVTNAGEQGLLGLAFAPDYATSGRVFVNFVNQAGDTVIARFVRMAGDPLRADPASRFDLQWPGGQRFIEQPSFTNHKGGNVMFGPDGFLYLGMGDGGAADDPFHNSQNPQTLLGKMIRVDVNVPASDVEGYNVPATNPFVNQSGVLPEIWAFGMRNPWRWSFDNPHRGGTGALVIGDVGQGAWEEIDYEPALRGGRNYGWRNREGAHNNVTNLAPFSQPLTDPVFEYSHAVGHSITGGFVYRGSALGTSFRGRYVFADFVDSRVWSVRLTVNPSTGEATASDLIEHTAALGVAAINPASFGEDAEGELYIVSYAGSVHRILPSSTTTPPGRQRPPSVPPVSWAVPRPTAGTLALMAVQALATGDAGKATQLLIAAAAEVADELIDSAKVCGDDRCALRCGSEDANDLPIGDFTLRRRTWFVPLRDAGDAAAHQLCGPQTRDDHKLKLIHGVGTIDH